MKPTDPVLAAAFALTPSLRPPPRVVRRRPGRGRLLRRVPLLVRLLGLASVGLLLFVLVLWAVPWFVVQFGRTVPGRIVSLTESRQGRSPVYRVRFVYHVGEEEFPGEARVDERTFDRLHSTAAVQVKVLPRWPGHGYLRDPAPAPRTGLLGLLCIGLVASGAFAGLLWLYLRRPLGQRRLVREGRAALGRIVHKELIAGRSRSGYVQYAYRAPRYGKRNGAGPGEVHLRTADKEWQLRMAVDDKDFEAAVPGAAVTVLYDPRQPSRSVIYVFAEYEAVPSADLGS